MRLNETPEGNDCALSPQATECLAMAAHELRTPLCGILGFAQLLAEKKLSPDDEDAVQMILKSAEAMERIMNDILNFACLEKGTLQIEPAPFYIRPLVKDIQCLLSLPAGKKEVLLEIHVSDEVPEKIVGDAGRLRQILINLLCNAVKFTDQGCVSLNISCRECSHINGGRTRLQFSVEDTGIGIAKEELEDIFEPFSRINGLRHRPGHGLGLAISKRLVDLMGGNFQVESEPGAGSRFTVTLDFGLPSTTYSIFCQEGLLAKTHL